MLLANLMIRPDQAAFEDVKERFRRVAVRNPGSFFPLSVREGRFLTNLTADSDVSARLIGHQMRFRGDLTAQDRRESLGVDVSDMEATRFSVTLNQGNNLHLLITA